ncbi:major facilitator superfamily transporter [Phlyctema vagabunda]|uniref:Major facilitator superfamily transporter n=1 Tax=Phlyctema vagabunda TaxID=108571 RepID=A0ABR4PDH2_9HELO
MESTPEKHSVDTTNHAVSSTTDEKHGRDLDDAFKYLHDHTNAESEGTNLSALRRKIDWHIVPIMFACYVLQFIDKVVINYAAVMGINKQLKLTKNDFSNVGSAFFIAYLIAEIPTGYILQKYPAGKWLGINVTLWGVSCAAAAGAFNYHSLLASRIMLGIFEAAIAPCLMLISSQYYTKSEQAPRFSLWYSGLGFGQILGGLISFAFQHVTSTSFRSWQAMFVFVGVVTSLIGIATFFILPDSPMTAKFLTPAEKAALLKHVSINQTGVQNKHFKLSQIWEILLDAQMWLLTICTICISVSSGVITTYSATLIQGFGFSSPHTALLNMPSGIVSIAASLIVGFGVRKSSNRWAWLAVCCIPGMIGGGLMSFMPKSNRAALLVGIYLVNAITGTLTVIYQWTMSNVAGHTKRTVAAALIAGSFSIGNIIGPQTFQARDAPEYRPAKIAVMATQAGGAVVSIVLFGYYVWANNRKDKFQASHEGASASLDNEQELWDNKTDKENPNFRYVY